MMDKEIRFIDSGFVEMYYNPDAAAGGQIVTLNFNENDIKEAAKNKDINSFFDHINNEGKIYLIDAGTPEFKAVVTDFVNAGADFEGCSRKTMNALKSAAGIELPRKKSKPER